MSATLECSRKLLRELEESGGSEKLEDVISNDDEIPLASQVTVESSDTSPVVGGSPDFYSSEYASHLLKQNSQATGAVKHTSHPKEKHLCGQLTDTSVSATVCGDQVNDTSTRIVSQHNQMTGTSFVRQSTHASFLIQAKAPMLCIYAFLLHHCRSGIFHRTLLCTNSQMPLHLYSSQV